MWMLIAGSITVALSACGFPRPADVDPPIDSGEVKLCTQTVCVASMLEVCGASGTVEHTEQCAFGCFSEGRRCYEFVPSNGLGPYLDQSAQESMITLPAGAVINTDTGAVTSAQGALLSVPTALVLQPGGPTLRVFLAQSWIINDVRIRGMLPVAFVSSDELNVRGMIDASADAEVNGPGALVCGGASGGGGSAQFYIGGRPPAGNSGGYPAFLLQGNGSGGGGFGTTGGAGGLQIVDLQIGAPGQVNGSAELVPLRGGCEGGGTAPQYRGSGGGAVQLVSGRAVHLIAGALSQGVVHVGGGRGIAGVLGTSGSLDTSPLYGPGGAGSGGGILIEAPRVLLDEGIALLAAGGGGGGYGACNPAPNGVDAAPGTAPALGGACPPGTFPAAAGGEGATTRDGAAGSNAAMTAGGSVYGSAGSGGGGLGRIRINTLDGEYSAGATSLVRGVATSGIVGRR